MTALISVLMLLSLFLVLLPLAAISIVTSIRFFYRKISKKKTLGIPKFVGSFFAGILAFALIPPLPYIVHDMQNDVPITGKSAVMTYDAKYDTENSIRYIEYGGLRYKELIPTISETEYIDVSDGTEFKYSKAVANVFDDSRSIIEKYVFNVFKYPVNSRMVYMVENNDMEDYISLDQAEFFINESFIDEKVEYYSDSKNWNYYVEDYNTEKFYDIVLDAKVADEISQLAYRYYDTDYDENTITEVIPDIVTFNVESDYDLIMVNGESKDKILLKSVGEIYIKDSKLYQFIEEEYNEDGSTDIYVLPISDNTSAKLTEQFKKVGLI